jgi:hypothetical protein
LSASAALLQDLGFNIDESSIETGVITCSKRREAISTGQICLGILFDTPYDNEQLIRASVVTHPLQINEIDKSKCQTAVRVTFQRIVINTKGIVTRRECIVDEKIYQEFFDKLSKSLFLEAHDL